MAKWNKPSSLSENASSKKALALSALHFNFAQVGPGSIIGVSMEIASVHRDIIPKWVVV